MDDIGTNLIERCQQPRGGTMRMQAMLIRDARKKDMRCRFEHIAQRYGHRLGWSRVAAKRDETSPPSVDRSSPDPLHDPARRGEIHNAINLAKGSHIKLVLYVIK